MNGIQTRHAGARVLVSGASAGAGRLSWRIVDAVTGAAAAAALENVQETEPVTDFVGGCSAEVEVGCGSTWDTLGEDVAAVDVEGVAADGCVGGEMADTEESAAEVGEEVYVQVLVGAFAQGWLHLVIAVARCPGIVGSEVDAGKDEGDAGRIVRFVEDGELKWR